MAELKERESFELQAAMRGLDISMFTPPSEKEYRNPATQVAWQLWQKARAQLARLNSPPVSAGATIKQSLTAGGVDEREARVIGYRPGMSEVTLLVDGGAIPAWMNIGDTVHISEKARAQLPSQGGEAVACWLKSSVPGADIVVLGNPADIHQAAADTKIPLYTHPADQVAEGVVVSRELLTTLAKDAGPKLVSARRDALALLNGGRE